ncbi:MAG: hypothetical protein M3P52_02405 [Actinomycetota bacterium]|nr:hypothetical protein [Actinomycetota bacterium]
MSFVTWLAAAASVVALGLGTAAAAADTRPSTPEQLSVQAGTGLADLYPGTSLGDLYLVVRNDTPTDMSFSQMVPNAVTSSAPETCSSNWVTVGAAHGLRLVAKPGTSLSVRIDDVVSMDLDAPDGCQGVAFTVAVILTPVIGLAGDER